MTEAHVQFIATDIVRTVRTCQEFATRETTFANGRDQIGRMIDPPKVIGGRLKRLREALGIKSQKAFADQIGIEKNTYNPYEKGTRPLTFETACLIRKKFKIPIDWLFWGDDEEIPYHIMVKLESRRQAA